MEQLTKAEYKRSQYKLLISISLLVFVVMLVFTIFYFVNYNQKYGYFKRVQAQVIAYEEVDGTEYAVIQYVVDNTEYQKTTEYTNRKIGSKTTIFYDENNPVGIIYDRDIRYYLLPTITTIFALADAGLIVMYVLHYRKKDKSKHQKSLKSVENENVSLVSEDNINSKVSVNTRKKKTKEDEKK